MRFGSLVNKSEFWVSREQFGKDLVAGVTVGIVALPLAIGFGITSGMSAQAGIATAILAGFIAALFGGSRYQVSGPTGAMTVVLIPVIAKNGIEAIPVLGLMAGLIVIAMSVFRLGGIINRIPWSVVEGFTLGIAVVIGLQQLPMALGVVKGVGDRTLQVAINTVKGAFESGVHLSTISILILTLFIKFNIVKIIERLKLKPYIPASFSALAITTVIVAIFKLDVAKIGDIPRNVFIWKGSGLQFSSSLITPAILIALLAAIESLLAARVADGMTHTKEKFHPNKELFGQGLATMVASIFGGQPATGAIARTSVNIRSGGKTKMAALIHALFLLIVVLVLSPVFALIPLPAIAGVLIGTSVRILNPHNIREQLRSTWQEVSTYAVTALVTITVDLIWAIFIGIALHFLLLLTRKKS
ncbi:SUL1 Sulfate permease and related transporters (MFS superfamily) [Candidatus Nanopelagicaceae bacterium]